MKTGVFVAFGVVVAGGVVIWPVLAQPRAGHGKPSAAVRAKNARIDKQLLAASTERQKGNPAGALKLCDAVLREDPRNSSAQFCRAHALEDSGRLREALAEFVDMTSPHEDSWSTLEKDVAMLHHINELRERLGMKWDRAITARILQSAKVGSTTLVTYAESPLSRAYEHIAVGQTLASEPQKAVIHFERATKLAPKDAGVVWQYAEARFEAKDPHGGKATLQRALALAKPESNEWHGIKQELDALPPREVMDQWR